jgi:hypothetical protein
LFLTKREAKRTRSRCGRFGFESHPFRQDPNAGNSNTRFIPLLAFVFDKARSEKNALALRALGFESHPFRQFF